MRPSQSLGFTALIVLTGLGGGTGCINHYHYYTEPGTIGVSGPPPGLTVSSAPQPTAGSIAYGSTCEVPRVESSAIPDRQVVAATPRPNRTLVSTPTGEPAGGPTRSLSSRFAWRQPEADRPPTTRVEGAVESDTVVR